MCLINAGKHPFWAGCSWQGWAEERLCPRYHRFRLGIEAGEGFSAGTKQQELKQELRGLSKGKIQVLETLSWQNPPPFTQCCFEAEEICRWYKRGLQCTGKTSSLENTSELFKGDVQNVCIPKQPLLQHNFILRLCRRSQIQAKQGFTNSPLNFLCKQT